jgi:hypothetical protein
LNIGYKGGTASLVVDTEVIARNAGSAGCGWSAGLVDLGGTSGSTISPTSGNGPAIGVSAPTITVPANVRLNTSTTARAMNVTLGGASFAGCAQESEGR